MLHIAHSTNLALYAKARSALDLFSSGVLARCALFAIRSLGKGYCRLDERGEVRTKRSDLTRQVSLSAFHPSLALALYETADPVLSSVGYSRKDIANVRRISEISGTHIWRTLSHDQTSSGGGSCRTSVPTGGLFERQGLYGATSVASIRAPARVHIVQTNVVGRFLLFAFYCMTQHSNTQVYSLINYDLPPPTRFRSPGCQRPSRYRLHRPQRFGRGSRWQ